MNFCFSEMNDGKQALILVLFFSTLNIIYSFAVYCCKWEFGKEGGRADSYIWDKFCSTVVEEVGRCCGESWWSVCFIDLWDRSTTASSDSVVERWRGNTSGTCQIWSEMWKLCHWTEDKRCCGNRFRNLFRYRNKWAGIDWKWCEGFGRESENRKEEKVWANDSEEKGSRCTYW